MNQASPSPAPRRARGLLHVLIALAVLAGGIAVGLALVNSRPRAERRQPTRQARLVEVIPARVTTEQAVIHAMGTVGPAREVRLTPRVSGQILEVSPTFVPGGRFARGETMITLDPTDFQIALQERQAELARMRADLALERGQQSIARREFEMLGEDIAEEDRGLVLRQPQLDKVQASVAAAEAAVERARLDLARCTVAAPFNAVVRDRQVNVGMQVGTGTALATLAGTDAYWVEVLVPVAHLRWLEIPQGPGAVGSPARIANPQTWGEGRYRQGRVVRLLSDLEEQGRMARLLVQVDDPLAPGPGGLPPLLLGEFVEVEIQGRTLADVVPIDRAHLRGGGAVWVLSPQGRLEIRPVEVVYRGLQTCWVGDGLRDGELVITTDLPAAVDGMPLRTGDDGPADGPPAKGPAS